MRKGTWKSLVLIAVYVFCLVLTGNAQFWTEDFGTGCNRGDDANAAVTSNGTWTVTNSGTNGSHAHQWFISSTSAISISALNCDQSCIAMPVNTSKTLHISNPQIAIGAPLNITFPADSGGFFIQGGYTAAGVDVTTEKRAESPAISCVGQNTVYIQFDYFEGGTSPNQNAVLKYFDGTTWFTLFDLSKSPTSNCGAAGLGEWIASSLIALPTSANNNPNVKIGFEWANNNMNTTANPIPSISVDNIMMYSTASPPSGVPLVDFAPVSTTSICANGSVSFQDLTFNADSIRWTFAGGTPATSTSKSPVVQYATPGTYNVKLKAYNSSGSIDTTAVNLVVVNNCTTLPVANFSADTVSICKGDSIFFTDLSTGFPTSWAWFFPGATNINFDTNQTPPAIIYDTVGLFEVNLLVENATGQDIESKTNYITVVNCPIPVASFNAAKKIVCVGDKVNITNQSQNANGLSYVFNGADEIDSSGAASPWAIYNTAGIYDITQVVVNSYGTDSRTDSGLIEVLDYPVIDAGVDQFIYAGESTTLSASGTAEGFYWEPREFLSCYLCKDPVASPIVTTLFFVINYYNNEAVCQVMDSVKLVVEEEYFASLPDIFSPNLDNKNDRLFVIGNGIFASDLIVFNRNGQLLYQYTKGTPYWDGTFKGKEVGPGVYNYVANVQFINNTTKLLKGTVTLIR